MSALGEVLLFEAQRLTVGHAELFFDKVYAHHFFRDGVFHLQAGVHFQEIEVAVFVHQKFYGTGTTVVHRPGGGYGFLAHLPAEFRCEERRRAFFHDFLVAALHGALPVEEMHHVAIGIPKYLELDMVRLFHEFLQIHRVVSERRHGFRAGRVVSLFHFVFAMDEAHAFSAATHGGFQHDGKTDFLADA